MIAFNNNSGQLSLHLPKKIRVDNFSGGGGASTGIEMGTGEPVDIAVNHNNKALGMHCMNHPYARHYSESVWDIDPVKACSGREVEIAWFSPDCTHHSKAKGSAPKSKDVRGLAWVAVNWMLRVRPEIVPLENVEEFKKWGPLDSSGNVIDERVGETFEAFVKIITTGINEDHPGYLECLEFLKIDLGAPDAKRLARGLGYITDYKELKACDFGAPTTRNRFFQVSRCDGFPVAWPEPTHGGGLLPYRTAAECIDWSIPVKSIFDRRKPLVENTLVRIARGIKRFVVETDNPFFVETPPPGMSLDNRVKVAAFIAKNYGGNYTGPGLDVRQPLSTITTVDHHSIVYAFFIKYYSKGGQWASLHDPMHTIPTKDRFGLVLIKVDGETYQMVDIATRGMQPKELYKAQGFPEGYIHDKWVDQDGVVRPLSKADQVYMCGNSVSPLVAKAVIQANINIKKTRSRSAA